MGRSNACPNHFLEWWTSASRVPRNNVYSSALWPSLGAFLLSYERGAEMLNFGGSSPLWV